ncbi:MAG: Asp-tRNA(Asn)/Glu-tRNA(Gln) amidotransferase subunit GatC [Ktedonobacterales bacterium]
MSIDRQTVDHVALLARLALSEQERHQLQEQLSTILEHINAISEADTSQVPATAQVLPLADVMRADKPRPFVGTQELVDRAPAHEGPYIRVRAVLENA